MESSISKCCRVYACNLILLCWDSNSYSSDSTFSPQLTQYSRNKDIFQCFAWKGGIIHEATPGPIPRHAITRKNLPLCQRCIDRYSGQRSRGQCKSRLFQDYRSINSLSIVIPRARHVKPRLSARPLASGQRAKGERGNSRTPRAGMRQAGWEVVALLVEKETANFHRASFLPRSFT